MSARNVFYDAVKQGSFVILDTETTSLTDGEIVSIAVIDRAGNTIFETLVKPVRPIPPDATRIHGITDYMVANKPTFADILPHLTAVLTGRDVFVYNAVYDRKMLHQSAEKAGLPKTDWKEISRWFCVMEEFAIVFGDWNEYRQSYKWQTLKTAAAYYRINQEGAHNALGDCQTTLKVLMYMTMNYQSSDHGDEGA